jgi:hypothetical protein
LHEIEDVAPLAAAEAAEALGLSFDWKDAEAGGVLLMKGTERERSTARLLMQRDSHILEHREFSASVHELI